MNLRDSVKLILSDKKARKQGLHVKHITRHILNINNNLFSNEKTLSFESLKEKVNKILLYDIHKNKNSQFNPRFKPQNPQIL